jgi:hypothetical protein
MNLGVVPQGLGALALANWSWYLGSRGGAGGSMQP